MSRLWYWDPARSTVISMDDGAESIHLQVQAEAEEEQNTYLEALAADA